MNVASNKIEHSFSADLDDARRVAMMVQSGRSG